MNITYCANCKKNVKYKIIDVEYEYEDEEVKLKYKGKKAICCYCKEEILIDEVEDYNQTQFEEEYRKKNEIITKEEIGQILEKYNIGKRPLSLLLGFGEITITRYLADYIPSKKNSILLKRILNEPEIYYSFLMTNKGNISDLAFKKSLKVILKLLDEENIEDDKIYEVSTYIISQLDVTLKGLQKILYYIQLFSFEFLNFSPFSSCCKKWIHGPVFGKIYYQYKGYGFNVITNDKECKFTLDKDLLEICDAVIKYFGCYSADVLEKFTHMERPWIETADNKIIEKSLIKEYAFEICDEHNINLISDIGKYSDHMFKKIIKN